MKIKYTKERLRSNYRFGLYFIILGTILNIIFNFSIDFFNGFQFYSIGLGLIFAGFFSLGVYYYEKKKQYLNIENGILKKNTLFPKSINLRDVIVFKRFAGDYILKTKEKKVTIDTQQIDSDSLVELISELKKFNLE